MKKIFKLLIACLFLIATAFTSIGCGAEEKLVIATNAFFAPFEYYDNGQFAGIDMDIAKILAQEMGLGIEIKDMEFDSVLVAVSSGNCDIGMAGLTVTETRKQTVDFCDAYFNASQMVIAKAGDAGLDGKNADQILQALEGKKIGVIFGYTGQFFVEGDEDFGFDGIGGAQISTYTNGSLAVAALKSGTIDYVIIDNVPAEVLVANNSGTKLIEVPLTEEEYAFAVKKGNTALKNKVNEIIAQMKSSGKLDEVIAAYFI